MNKFVLKKGVSVVEALVGSAILTFVLFAFTSSLSIYSAASADATKRTQALFLAEEGIEITRSIRDRAWNNIGGLDTEEVYGLSLNETAQRWELSRGEENVDEFSRRIILGDVYRNSNDQITESTSSIYDAGTRLIRVEVSWQSRRGEQTIALESLLTNAFQN